MKFLQRRQYCTTCDKHVSFLQITNKKSVQKQLQCPLCKSDVVSYWEEQNKMHVFPLTIGFSFFISAIIFNVWRFFVRAVETRDNILTAVYIVLTVILVVYATRYRKKPEPQETSDLTIKKLSTYRKQYLYVAGIILIIQLLTAVIDYFLIYHFL
ncbi:MAG: hypothetical protein KAS52_00660 [Candidatus Heimdallarchaeota archaeon]|nr:hypothetical protein [Candidatus Heimdallarchaeota archaeon]